MTAVAGTEARNSSASLRKALALLDAVAGASPGTDGISLGELSKLAGLNKSTLLRLATPLLEENLLERDPESGKFRLATDASGLASHTWTAWICAAWRTPNSVH